MAISKDDILEAVSAMSVMDLNDLVKAFEENSACPQQQWLRPVLQQAQQQLLKNKPNSTSSLTPSAQTKLALLKQFAKSPAWA